MTHFRLHSMMLVVTWAYDRRARLRYTSTNLNFSRVIVPTIDKKYHRALESIVTIMVEVLQIWSILSFVGRLFFTFILKKLNIHLATSSTDVCRVSFTILRIRFGISLQIPALPHCVPTMLGTLSLKSKTCSVHSPQFCGSESTSF